MTGKFVLSIKAKAHLATLQKRAAVLSCRVNFVVSARHSWRSQVLVTSCVSILLLRWSTHAECEHRRCWDSFAVHLFVTTSSFAINGGRYGAPGGVDDGIASNVAFSVLWCAGGTFKPTLCFSEKNPGEFPGRV